MKIPKDTLRSYTTYRRMWDIFFYIATVPRSVSLDEIYQLFRGKWNIKTIRRDMQLLEDYGIWKTKTYEGIPSYRFQGSPGPFTRQTGKKWCYTCRSFVSMNLFKPQRTTYDGLTKQCAPCRNMIQKRYYQRNRKFHLNRQHRYYRSRVKRQLNVSPITFLDSRTKTLTQAFIKLME